jgi:hypothetical protein
VGDTYSGNRKQFENWKRSNAIFLADTTLALFRIGTKIKSAVRCSALRSRREFDVRVTTYSKESKLSRRFHTSVNFIFVEVESSCFYSNYSVYFPYKFMVSPVLQSTKALRESRGIAPLCF